MNINFKDSKWSFIKTLNRLKYILKVIIIVVALVIISFWSLKFFSKKEPEVILDEMINKCMDYINKEMDRILELGNRQRQNREFRKLKPALPLESVRMTQTTAVFKYTYTTPPVVLKRIIWNPNNVLNEDLVSSEFKGKSEHIVNTILTNRTTRMVPNDDSSEDEEQQTLIWIFLEFMDIKITDRFVNGDENIISDIIRDALKGLKYLHDNNYAHLDLKIANIMGKQHKDGVVYKLIDFGFTQHFKDQQAVIPKKNYGTFPYKPPEVIYDRIHGLKADIWSLGAITWYLSLQYIPFYDESMQKDMKKYKTFISEYRGTEKDKNNHRFFFKRGTSNELKDFIKTCMQIDYRKRPTVDALLEHPFILKSTLDNYTEDERDEIDMSSIYLSE